MTTRQFTAGCFGGLVLTLAIIAGCALYWTGDGRVLIAVLFAAVAALGWMAVFLRGFGRRLQRFSDDFCETLDGMIADHLASPISAPVEETLFARMMHQLERLYDALSADRQRLDGERAALQTFVSDVSHQTKTPLANLKMLNETLLNRPLDEEERRAFSKRAPVSWKNLIFSFRRWLNPRGLKPV